MAVGSDNQPTLAPPQAWAAPTSAPDDTLEPGIAAGKQHAPTPTPAPIGDTNKETISTRALPATPPAMPRDAPQAAPPPVGVEQGHTAPDFELRDLEGQLVRLSDYRGQVVMINFWAIWCGYCRAEMPVLQAAYERYQGDGFVVLAVDVMDRKDPVVEYVREAGLTFPVLLDRSSEVSTQYRVRGLPTSFYVDRDGVIQEIHIGPVDEAMMAGILAQLGVH